MRRDRKIARDKKLARDSKKPFSDMYNCEKRVYGWSHYFNINNVKVRMGTAYIKGLCNYTPTNIDECMGKDKAVNKKEEEVKMRDFNSVGFKLLQVKASK